MKDAASAEGPLGQVTEALGDLIARGTRIGLDVLAALGRMPLPALDDVLRGAASRAVPHASCTCHIPPPCWAPQPLGELASHVCPGAAATLRIRVTNCGAAKRTFRFEATGAAAGVTLAPATLILGALERGQAVASVAVPATASCGEEQEALIWVRGCQDHVLRWRIRVAARGVDSCHQIDVEDCPDLVHHWYDHFYCQRPCPPGQREA